MIGGRAALYAVWILSVALAVYGYGHMQKQKGRDEVQAKFDAYVTKQTTDTLQASLVNQETSLLKQKAVDRSRQNDYENAKKLAAANSNLRGAVAGLRDTIAAFDNQPQAGNATAPGPGADESAAIARELLGECASRYQDVAREAGELASKVIGLQGFLSAALMP
jgi:hypothetical protein